MIGKHDDKINQIVQKHTSYRNGENVLFLSLRELLGLFQKIVDTEETTEFLRVIPFYENVRYQPDIELDEYMFFLSCRETINESDVEAHLLDCVIGEAPMTPLDEEGSSWENLFPLCRFDDPGRFGELIQRYEQYLMNTLLPFLFEQVKKDVGLKEKDFAYGRFCFEVQSD
ncbi:hypothetical protein L479_01302 [Exiguobacterium sp. S17]|nr:hypothetical protein L479_01302 [Exiguobacterium sp. S17]